MTRLSGNSVHTASAKQHRFHLLDAIRGIAALLVVAYHAPPDFGRLLPFRSGFLAVDLFFALSGFVIAFSYERRLREGLPYRNFVVARVIRLYPMYFFATMFALTMGVAGKHMLSAKAFPIELLLALLLLPDVFHGSAAAVYPMDFPAWSLLCELLSNIAYAALILWHQAGRWTLYAVVFASALFMIVWTREAGTVDSGSVLRTLPMGLARVSYSFGVGVLAFRYFCASHRKHLTGISSWLLSGGICLMIFLALATRLTQSFVSQLIAVLLVFPVLIYFGSMTTVTGSWGKLAAFLGDISYPMYLLHIPFFMIFRSRSMQQLAAHHAEFRLPFALLALSFLVALSWAVGSWFDLPVRRFLTARYNRWLLHAA